MWNPFLDFFGVFVAVVTILFVYSRIVHVDFMVLITRIRLALFERN